MAVHNGAAWIEAAIDSLVGQSLPPGEIIVVDDGSSDDSGARAVAAGGGLVQLIVQPNRGYHAARNAGRAAARGKLIHFFDADDILPDGSLDTMHRCLDANPGWDVLFGRWRNIWIEALAHEAAASANAYLVGEQSGLMITAGLYRRTMLERMAPFPENAGWHGSALWLAQIARDGATIGRIDRAVLDRRIHHDNMSRKKSVDELFDLAFKLHRSSRAAAKR